MEFHPDQTESPSRLASDLQLLATQAPRVVSLSVVVPVYNESGNLLPFYREVCHALEMVALPAEIIFVDDGSVDQSEAELRELQGEDPRVRVVLLSRNFGHQYAITAGMEHARGNAVIIMDADLQHPPSMIPRLVDKWREGYHVVYTIRERTPDAPWYKRVTSDMFYRFIHAVSKVDIVPQASDFRLIDRTVVDCLIAMKERSRFMRGMVRWVGFRQTGIPFVAQRRFGGVSKFSFAKMVGLALDGITGFSSIPLRWSAYLGFLVAVSVIPYGLWAAYAKLFTDTVVPGWASLMVSVLFLGAVQLISIGILGEYVGRIYTEVKGRPMYIVEETLGFEHAGSVRDCREPVAPSRRAAAG